MMLYEDIISQMEQLFPLLQGPAAATVIMGVILSGAWKFLNGVIVPRVDGLIKENNIRFEKMVAEHQSDRNAWLLSIDKISERIDKMSETTAEMSKAVDDLNKSMNDILKEKK